MKLRWWIPGAACLLGGVAGRFVLEWDGITGGRLQYARIAFWQLGWYAAGLLMIGIHLLRVGTQRIWLAWLAAVILCGAAVLSSCPP